MEGRRWEPEWGLGWRKRIQSPASVATGRRVPEQRETQHRQTRAVALKFFLLFGHVLELCIGCWSS